jgi:hypothetical protein
MWIFLAAGLFAAAILIKAAARKKMQEYVERGPASSKPKPLRNNAVDDLVGAALRLLEVKVGMLDKTGEAVPADASIWHWEDDNLLMNDGVPMNADDIPGAAVDFASATARTHTAPPPITEEVVRKWLEEGVSKSIARFVLDGVKRSEKRFAIMTRTSPPPTAAELAEMKAENERERAEMDKLMGNAVDTSNLPPAKLRK